jgi:hypothetical protein
VIKPVIAFIAILQKDVPKHRGYKKTNTGGAAASHQRGGRNDDPTRDRSGTRSNFISKVSYYKTRETTAHREQPIDQNKSKAVVRCVVLLNGSVTKDESESKQADHDDPADEGSGGFVHKSVPKS